MGKLGEMRNAHVEVAKNTKDATGINPSMVTQAY